MKRFIILGGVVLLGAAAALMYTLFPQGQQSVTASAEPDGEITLTETEKKTDDKVSFSVPSGFYAENISVELSAAGNVYFTTDGSDPAPESGTLYTAPIEINASTEVAATTIKAVAVNSDGEAGKIYTTSYVTGQDVDERFDSETLVFVLSTDPYNLYDYEYGIAVPGKIYDDYVKEHPGEEIPYNAPGNYYMTGMEAERPIYVEVFESNGTKVIDQAAGVRLSGGYSRVPDQKSLRLIARKMYDPDNGKFKYAFFNGAETESGVPVSEYDRIVLRNGANDREFAGVRDELSQTLAQDYGYPVTQHVTPAAVFLNGEYYGFSWVHENYNEDYLATYFGGDEENYEIISNTEYAEEGSERALADYQKVLEYYDRDLTDDKTFAEFCELVDIDNFIQYYAMEIFVANKDWPDNNYKAFRYYPADGGDDSGFRDGKWRFMFFDAEYAWSLYGDRPNQNTLRDLLTGSHMSGGESKALIAVLSRDDMKQKFAAVMSDLTAYAFEENHILETLDELCEKSNNEQFYALDHGVTSTWANRETFENSRQQIRDFAAVRKTSVFNNMYRLFEWDSEEYSVSVTCSQGAVTKLSSQTKKGRGSLWGSYNRSVSVPLSVEVADGWEFAGWEINGESYAEQSLTLNAAMADSDGRVSVKLLTRKSESTGLPLQIKTICTRSKAGYIVLYNPNSEDVSTAGLYLTDKPDKLQRWSLPVQKIAAGGTLMIVTDNNKTQQALHQLQASFSLKAGETLILSDSGGNILGSVEVPEIGDGFVYSLQDYGEYRVVSE